MKVSSGFRISLICNALQRETVMRLNEQVGRIREPDDGVSSRIVERRLGWATENTDGLLTEAGEDAAAAEDKLA